MRHKLLTQRAHFLDWRDGKKGTLSQHFVTHVVPPLHKVSSTTPHGRHEPGPPFPVRGTRIEASGGYRGCLPTSHTI